jgi:hypothetical protein
MNTLLYLSRNESNSVSLSIVKSWEIITTLSRTLGSSRTLLVPHSSSIGLHVELPSPSDVATVFGFLILQTIHIFMARGKTLLYVSRFFLIAMS